MTARTILPSKSASELLNAIFEFGSMMEFGDTILEASATVTVYSGVDPNPNTILYLTPVFLGETRIQQDIVGGLPGVTYIIHCHADTSMGLRFTKQAYLSILPTSRF